MLWLNYYGPPGTITGINYSEAINPTNFAAGFFSNKVVFVGAKSPAGFTGAGKDEMATPYTTWGRGLTPGVEIQATASLNLLQGDWLRRIPLGSEWLLLVVAGGLAGFGLARLRPWLAIGAAAAAAVAVAVVAHLLVWKFRVWFNWTLVAGLQIPVALVWAVGYNSLHAYIAKQVLQRSLSLYLSPAQADHIVRNPGLLRPGAEEKEVTLLFTDIADYSTISQKTASHELVAVLNEYFQTAVGSLHSTNSTVVKFIGDAIFAIWNAPETQADHQGLACRAVLQLRADLAQFDQELQRRFEAGTIRTPCSLRTRIGLHSGKAFVGNFGGAQRFDYTAIGDSVNLASRLEGLNKYLGTEVLLSGDFQAAIDGRYVTRFVGYFKPKGFLEFVPVFELIGPPAMSDETRVWREAFARAWLHFSQSRFEEAAEGFKQTSCRRAEAEPRRHPGQPDLADGPSQFYLKQIERFAKEPPPAGWQGEVEPEGK
jgi:adenylate cyclase